jgi:hypothetical protein
MSRLLMSTRVPGGRSHVYASESESSELNFEKLERLHLRLVTGVVLVPVFPG